MDDRAQKLIAAGRAVLPRLGELLGDQSEDVERKLKKAIDGPQDEETTRHEENMRDAVRDLDSDLREALDTAIESSHAEAIRDILFQHPATRKYLEDAVPEAKSPRPLGGGPPGRRKWR
jgi:hypothetical protein